MMRKILLGMAVVAGICVIATAGYRFGKYLRQSEQAQAATVQPVAV